MRSAEKGHGEDAAEDSRLKPLSPCLLRNGIGAITAIFSFANGIILRPVTNR